MQALRQADMTVNWNLAKSDIPGCRRAHFSGIDGTMVGVNLLLLPAGQRSPLHTYTGEHIIVLLQGSIDFVHEAQHYVMDSHDMLFIPADIWYEYVNVGAGDAIFVGIKAAAAEWPAHSAFAD